MRDVSSTAPSMRALERLEHEAVALEQRILLAGVDPPAPQDLVADAPAVVDEPLDRIGDLELATRRRLDLAHRGVDVGIEEVDADDREVRRRVLRLLDELDDLAVVAEHRDARLSRILDVREQDLRREHAPVGAGAAGALGLERVDELLEPLLEHVVAEVHDEVVVAEEVAGDQHAVRETRAARPGGCR